MSFNHFAFTVITAVILLTKGQLILSREIYQNLKLSIDIHCLAE
jgi:hypothetical protein